MKAAGIANVRALAGGIPEWIRDGNPVVKGTNPE